MIVTCIPYDCDLYTVCSYSLYLYDWAGSINVVIIIIIIMRSVIETDGSWKRARRSKKDIDLKYAW